MKSEFYFVKVDLTSSYSNLEKAIFKAALLLNDGNRTHTAKQLGVSLKTIKNKCEEFRKIDNHEIFKPKSQAGDVRHFKVSSSRKRI